MAEPKKKTPSYTPKTLDKMDLGELEIDSIIEAQKQLLQQEGYVQQEMDKLQAELDSITEAKQAVFKEHAARMGMDFSPRKRASSGSSGGGKRMTKEEKEKLRANTLKVIAGSKSPMSASEIADKVGYDQKKLSMTIIKGLKEDGLVAQEGARINAKYKATKKGKEAV